MRRDKRQEMGLERRQGSAESGALEPDSILKGMGGHCRVLSSRVTWPGLCFTQLTLAGGTECTKEGPSGDQGKYLVGVF